MTNYKVRIKSDKIISKVNLRKPKYKPIPFILTIGNLIHKFKSGNSLTLYYSYYPSEKKMKLIYAISSKDCSLKNLIIAMNEFYMDGQKHNANSFESLIVNKRLISSLKKNGWKFDRKSWFIGDYYKKK